MLKKVIWAALLMLMMAAPAVHAKMPPHITVSGTAVIEVTPDEMIWFLQVENRGPEIKALAKQHSAIVTDVLSFLREKSIAKKDVQTSMMQFGENWNYQNGRRIAAGYYASSNIRFKLTDFSKYQGLWEGLSAKPGAGVTNITYAFAGRSRVQAKARHQALRAARDKAAAMAETLDASIGTPLAIEEISGPDAPRPRTANIAMAEADFKAGGEAGGFALGQMEIRSRVRVSFSLVSKTP